jgi:hypothetical protein
LKQIWILIWIACSPLLLVAQQKNEETVRSLVARAIKPMDAGDPDAAIAILDSAIALAPGAFLPLYEKGFTYYLKKITGLRSNILSRLWRVPM